MTGGILQIIARGIDDIFLLSEPQITMFKIVYRRHTSFTKTEELLHFTNKLKFGSTSRCRIRRLADLVHKLYLAIELPEIDIRYHRFTYGKLNSILKKEAGINLNGLIIKQHIISDELDMNNITSSDDLASSGFSARSDDLVSLTVFDDIIVPLINNKIQEYIDLITISKQQIKILKDSQKMILLGADGNINIDRYKNPETINKISNILHINNEDKNNKNRFIPLPHKYFLYKNILSKNDPKYRGYTELYNYLFDLYNNIDAEKIKIYNSSTVATTIMKSFIDKIYQSKSHNSIGNNILFIDELHKNNKNNIINYLQSKSTTNEFIKHDILVNLDSYLTYKRFIHENTNDETLQNLRYLMDHFLYDNITQFNIILQILDDFKFYKRVYKHEKVLMYGMFYLPNTNNIIKDEYEAKIFDFSHKNENRLYYINWVKSTVNMFFNSINNVFTGKNSNRYLHYYNDDTYTDYLNMVDSIPIPTHLSSILQSTNITFSTALLNEKIKFLEFTPFITVYNLYNLLIPLVPNSCAFNYNKYFDFLVDIYKGGLTSIDTYLLDKTKHFINRIDVTKIVTNLFTPYKTYKSEDIIKQYLDHKYIHYLKCIYTDHVIPLYLFPLDVVLLMMANDLLIDLHHVENQHNHSQYMTLMKTFQMYISDMEIHHENSEQIEGIECIKNDKDFAKVSRLSSIWNNISRNQMRLFNELFTNSLLSTQYFTQDPIGIIKKSISEENNIIEHISLPQKGEYLGLGKTLHYVYKLFADIFLNENKKQNENHIPLEYILNKTNFYSMEIIDEHNKMETAIMLIKDTVLNDISTVKESVRKYKPLLEIKNIQLDNKYFYYNTLFNIMTNGVKDINFTIVASNDDQQIVKINNVTLKEENNDNNNDNNHNNEGYIAKIYRYFRQRFDDKFDDELNDILGDVYNKLEIVPLENDTNEYFKCSKTYGTMFLPFPKKTIKTNMINRGILDVLIQLFYSVSLTNTVSKDIYEKILNHFNIRINKSEFIENTYDTKITIMNNKPSERFSRFFSSDNNPGNLYSDQKNNSDITNEYNSFETIYGIIKFILDNIIHNLANTNEIFNNILSYAPNMLQEVINNYENIITNTQQYLKNMTATDNISFKNSNLYLRLMRLRKTINNPELSGEFAWSKYIGFNIIDYVSITIGGQEIDKHSGTWLYLDYLLNKSISKEYGATMMLGNIPELTAFDNNIKRKKILYIPLRFWFCKYFTTSLPLISMRYTDVDIDIKLKDFDEIAYYFKEDTYIRKKPKLTCYIVADYIYLDSDERIRFSEVKHEYLIDTVLRNGVYIKGKEDIEETQLLTTYEPNPNGSIITNLRLYFSNMCKELIWIFKFQNVNETEIDRRHRILNWDDYGYNSYSTAIEDMRIEFNGVARENWKKPGYFNLLQPYYKGYSSLTENIYLYTFAIHPKYLQPSGAVNLDKLSELGIAVKMSYSMKKEIDEGRVKMIWDVYSRSTNILRVMSGMAGLAFYGS